MIILLIYGEVYDIPVWSLHLVMSLNKKHYIRRVVSKLVEARYCQHLLKIHISPYMPVHFFRSCHIWTPLSNLEMSGLVGWSRNLFAVFKARLKLASYLARVVTGYPTPDPVSYFGMFLMLWPTLDLQLKRQAIINFILAYWSNQVVLIPRIGLTEKIRMSWSGVGYITSNGGFRTMRKPSCLRSWDAGYF